MKEPQDHKPKKDGPITVQGIELTIPMERVKDWDVVEGVAIMQDEGATKSEKMVASVLVTRRLLGDDYARVKSELRAAHDGVLDSDTMGAFLTEVFKELNPSA